MKKSKLNTSSEKKMYDEITNFLDQPRGPRQYEVQGEMLNDFTQMVHQLAVFDKTEFKILKLNVIDYIGERFECADNKKNKWLNFKNAVLFNFMNEQEFNQYYEQYTLGNFRPMKREKLLYWLKESRRKLTTIQPDETQQNMDPFIINSKRI